MSRLRRRSEPSLFALLPCPIAACPNTAHLNTAYPNITYLNTAYPNINYPIAAHPNIAYLNTDYLIADFIASTARLTSF